ncbi:hypothetical protein NDU88_003355 [Pleurodeles waltl]|uniref:Uncharacterized protein n=1 Tax=Pleurodeles waltl TaxID=8319 RepID=A0AAV7T581_PLEWA|nr:hypothetical protein NDU88_003355 [Pleurodeles waltl]
MDLQLGALSSPLYKLVKPSRGMQDSVPGTFPPGGPEDEAQDVGSHPGAPEPELAEEASPQPSGLLAPSWCGMPEEGSAQPRAWRGLIRAHELSHAGALALRGQRTKIRMGGPTPGPPRALAWGPAGGPELKLEGEASAGPSDFQAQTPRDTAGWRKGVSALGPGGVPAGAPEPKQAGEASSGPVDSQAWAP